MVVINDHVSFNLISIFGVSNMTNTLRIRKCDYITAARNSRLTSADVYGFHVKGHRPLLGLLILIPAYLVTYKSLRLHFCGLQQTNG